MILAVLVVHCLIGGGQTGLLAAGFHTLSEEFGVSLTKISLTTGVYQISLGFGSVILGPTALLYGKRPGTSSDVYINESLFIRATCVFDWVHLVCNRSILVNAPCRTHDSRDWCITLRMSSFLFHSRGIPSQSFYANCISFFFMNAVSV